MNQRLHRLFILSSALSSLTLFGTGCLATQTTTTPIESDRVTTTTTEALVREREIRTVVATIRPGVPEYHFQIVSVSSTAQTAGSIQIFRGTTSTMPIQVIPLPVGRWFADLEPVFFEHQDVNFDGYMDIGLPIEGGAKWIAYEYWFFDKTTGTFKTTRLTDELAHIGFNFVSFDSDKHQMTTDNLSGSGWRTLYQIHNDHVKPLKDEQLEERWTMPTLSTPSLTIACVLSTKTYLNGKAQITTQNLAQPCNRSLHTIPFTYPDDYKELFQ